MVKKIAIPTRTDFVFRTKCLQNRETGLLEGRQGPRSKPPYKNIHGDYTAVKRVSRDFDKDKDGDIDYKKGEIAGREKKEKGITWVKGNRRQRAYRR